MVYCTENVFFLFFVLFFCVLQYIDIVYTGNSSSVSACLPKTKTWKEKVVCCPEHLPAAPERAARRAECVLLL